MLIDEKEEIKAMHRIRQCQNYPTTQGLNGKGKKQSISLTISA